MSDHTSPPATAEIIVRLREIGEELQPAKKEYLFFVANEFELVLAENEKLRKERDEAIEREKEVRDKTIEEFVEKAEETAKILKQAFRNPDW